MSDRSVKKVPTSKRAAVIALFAAAGAVTALGIVFGVYCLVNDVNFSILGNDVSGVVFAAVIAFLGVRYIISVFRLRKKVYAQEADFSWSNFRIRGKH